MTRTEKASVAAAMRDAGASWREMREGLGVSQSYLGALLSDPDGSRDRARKRRYGGTCEGCGRRTDGSNGSGRAPKMCATCTAQKQHDERYWTAERVLDAIKRFAAANGRPPSASEWLSRPGKGFPVAGTVQRECGSWANAIEAAGFPRPKVGCYNRTLESKARLSAAQRKRWGVQDTYGELTIMRWNVGTDQVEGLKRRAEEEGTSVAEQARRALAAYLEPSETRRGFIGRLLLRQTA